ncbi:MAG: hypothetical protein CME31_00860 [Gimesia sp.]|uniref:DUF488 domain-containing protein n=1 Tax=Gimesia maris TaxID=122 RepID=A0A3D3RCR6_9PLAN|nr:hypothetical protein [Gimesia sp.]HCO26644.1 hypothetical protein [Gimesia maris]|tara:strand:+ start:2643 stop:3218 length:576 start_codon:yes stop_codon:yes gene_type:complete
MSEEIPGPVSESPPIDGSIMRPAFQVCSMQEDHLISNENQIFVWIESNVPQGSLKQSHLWLPELCPEAESVEWFSFRADRWNEFSRRYRSKLSNMEKLCEELRCLAHQSLLTLIYRRGTPACNIAMIIEKHLVQLECQHRWEAGLMIGGYTTPVKSEIEALGGLWFNNHKTWMMPDEKSWRSIINLLPGDF